MQNKISLFKVHMPESIKAPLWETLFSGFIGQGPKVNEFEECLKSFVESPYPVTLNSATSGLQLALRLANVGPGDEVISTAMTCTATNMPILASGARIVWADVDPISGNITPEAIEERITPQTKAILVVHWGGQPCKMNEINQIAKKHSLKVIEDAAHAFGSEYMGRKIGNHSDYVVFSFQAIKHITTVDGGVLFCKSEEDYNRAKLLRWYGIDREEKGRTDFRCENNIPEWGYKFHMNDVAATIGIEQLKFAGEIVRKHRDNAAFYYDSLQGIPGVRLVEKSTDWKSAYWLFTMHTQRRDEFTQFMSDNGVMTSKVHNRNDIHTAFAEAKTYPMPGLEKFYESMVCIPVGWWITESERSYIVEKIRAFSKNHI